MPLVTRVFASSEHAWDPMASSSVNFCRKTRTVHQRHLNELQMIEVVTFWLLVVLCQRPYSTKVAVVVMVV
jgi:hypothetical protein